MNDKTELEFKPVRGNLTESEKKEILVLWKSGGAELSETDMLLRLNDIFILARDSQQKLVGISSTFIDRDPILNVKLHYIRVFVSNEQRQASVARNLLTEAIITLANDYDPSNLGLPIGAAWVFENDILKDNYKLAVSKVTRSTFYGYPKPGEPGRVAYFKGAKI